MTDTSILAFDFAAGEYAVDGEAVAAAGAVTVTRAGAALALDIAGEPASFATNTARITDGKGLILDPPRQNLIENARHLEGAVEGVVGSGGALPTGWYVSEGLGVEVLDIVAGDHWTTIDLRLTFDNSEGLDEESPRLRFRPGNGVDATAGEAFGASIFAAVLASTARRQRLALLPRNAGGSTIVSTYGTLPTVFSRVGITTVTPGETVKVDLAVQLTVFPESIATVDLRLSVPMLERGAGVTSPIARAYGTTIEGDNAISPTFAGAGEGVVGETGEGWERGANALTAPDMDGAIEGIVGSGGAMPDGWFNSSNIDTIEILDVTDTGPFTRIDIRLTRANGTGSNQTMQVRFEPSHGLAAAEGERWTMAVFSEILSGGAANPRLTVYARDSGGASLATNSVSLAGGGAETVSTLTMPVSTAFATPALQATAAPSATTTVELRLWLPHFAEDVGEEIPAGLLPTGWVTDGIDTVEIVDLDNAISGFAAMDVALTKAGSDDGQLKFSGNTAIAAAPGQTWIARIRSVILAAETHANVRLGIDARNAGGSILQSATVVLAGGGAEDTVSLTMPADTAFVTGRVRFDGPGTLSLRLARPVVATVTLSGATTGERGTETVALVPALPALPAGSLVLEYEERAGAGAAVIAALDFGTHIITLAGGGAPGLVVTRASGLVVGENRRAPVLPGALVRVALSWAAGQVRYAFSSALDRVADAIAVSAFAPAAAPAIAFAATPAGANRTATAIRFLEIRAGEKSLGALRTLAADPGVPAVPAPWRLYRHAWISPDLADVPATPFWEPETYDTSDTSIGWTGGGAFEPPESQTVPPDMIVPSMYGPPNPDNPGRDVVHPPSFALFTAIVTPIRQVQKDVVAATDAYLATGATSVAYATIGWLLQAAEAGVLTGVRNDTGTAQIERWLGCAGSAYLKVCRAGFGTPAERAVIEAYFQDLAEQLIAFQIEKRAIGSSYAINNHYFWAAWGISVVGLILGNREMIEFGHECLDFAIDASADAGAIPVELDPAPGEGEGFPGEDDDPDPEEEGVEGIQPAESVRLTRALHYHNFAMPPLVALAEIAIADGRDPYGRRGGQLHKMAQFTSDAIDDPALMTAVQEAILGPGKGAAQDTSMWTGPSGVVPHRLPNGSQMAWMWIYTRRFPDSDVAAKWIPRLDGLYSALRSSNLGGDMRLLYPRGFASSTGAGSGSGLRRASRFVAPNLSRLPPPDALAPLDFDTVVRERLAALVVRATARGLTGDSAALVSVPLTVDQQAGAVHELLTRSRVNEAVRAVLLVTATGPQLDHIAATYYGISRLVVTPATDAAPAVMESDAAFRARTALAPEAWSVSGPEGSYIFHALEADGNVADVAVYSEEDGVTHANGEPVLAPEVLVVVLSRLGDGTPTDTLVTKVLADLSRRTVRPVGDKVFVEPAEIRPYAVSARLKLARGTDATAAVADARARVEAYAAARRRVGAVVQRLGLGACLMVPGVEDIVLLSPAADIDPGDKGAGYCTGITIETEVAARVWR